MSLSTFGALSNHGKHATAKCPVESCGYVGRSDNVKRHVKRNHKHTLVVPPVVEMVPPMPEAPNDVLGDSFQPFNQLSIHSANGLTKREIRSRECKKKLADPLV